MEDMMYLPYGVNESGQLLYMDQVGRGSPSPADPSSAPRRGDHRQSIAARVDRRAAREERLGEGESAVICQSGKVRVGVRKAVRAEPAACPIVDIPTVVGDRATIDRTVIRAVVPRHDAVLDRHRAADHVQPARRRVHRCVVGDGDVDDQGRAR
jgi:hypothetical protein